MCIWVRSRMCGCLVTWFCYQLIAKPGNRTAATSWPYPYWSLHLLKYLFNYSCINLFISFNITVSCMLWSKLLNNHVYNPIIIPMFSVVSCSQTYWSAINVCLTHLPLVPNMCQWIETALVQIMACRLFGTKQLSKPMLGYCQLNSWEQVSVKFESELYHFHSRKCIWKCRLPKCRPFCSGGRWVKWTL